MIICTLKLSSGLLTATNGLTVTSGATTVGVLNAGPLSAASLTTTGTYPARAGQRFPRTGHTSAWRLAPARSCPGLALDHAMFLCWTKTRRNTLAHVLLHTTGAVTAASLTVTSGLTAVKALTAEGM